MRLNYFIIILLILLSGTCNKKFNTKANAQKNNNNKSIIILEALLGKKTNYNKFNSQSEMMAFISRQSDFPINYGVYTYYKNTNIILLKATYNDNGGGDFFHEITYLFNKHNGNVTSIKSVYSTFLHNGLRIIDEISYDENGAKRKKPTKYIDFEGNDYKFKETNINLGDEVIKHSEKNIINDIEFKLFLNIKQLPFYNLISK